MTAPGQFIVHVTTAGERWDLLAWRYYGDATDYSPIIVANPKVPIDAVFDAGISIEVPIVQKSSAAQTGLPPWRIAKAVNG